jgi:hypothetical protein
MSTDDLTRVPVRVERGRQAWLLVYVEPCEGCGERHQHGGGSVRGPVFDPPGTRIIHCSSSHRPFREDCQRRKYTRECYEHHVPPTAMVELYYPAAQS